MSNRTAMVDDSRHWHDGDGLHIDVRGLPCPDPMVTLLRLIDSGTVKGPLLAHISQEPLLLYPELETRGWTYQLIAESDADGVVLQITRAAP